MKFALKRTMRKTRKKTHSNAPLPKNDHVMFHAEVLDLKISLYNVKMFTGFHSDTG